MKREFKNQRSQFAIISAICLLLSSRAEDYALWVDWIFFVLSIWAVCVFVHRIRKYSDIGAYNLLGVVFPIVYAIGIYVNQFFEITLFVLWALLIISMIFCMHTCKEEDAKSIALLHMTYMTSCALAIPVWLRF